MLTSSLQKCLVEVSLTSLLGARILESAGFMVTVLRLRRVLVNRLYLRLVRTDLTCSLELKSL